MKDLIVIYVVVQIIFVIVAILKLNIPEGIFITIIPALIIAFIVRRILFGKIT